MVLTSAELTSAKTPDLIYIDSSPALGPDGAVYFGSFDGKVYALKPDGRPRWTWKTGGPVTSSPAVAGNGVVWVGSEDGKLYAVSESGQLTVVKARNGLAMARQP